MEVIDRLNILPIHSVLDLGCGEGIHYKFAQIMSPSILVELDIDLTSLRNISPIAVLDNLQAKETNVPRVCADALKLPFPDESFDRVICSLVIYFLPFQTALFELNRVVKSGGKVYLRVPLLTLDRLFYIIKTFRSNPRLSIYNSLLSVNGLFYSLSGKQLMNPFLRNDRWAFHVPRHRFNKALKKAGFLLVRIEIDRPRPHNASIDAWLQKV